MTNCYEGTEYIACPGAENPAGTPQYDKPFVFEVAINCKLAAIIDDNYARAVPSAIQGEPVRNESNGRIGPRAQCGLIKTFGKDFIHEVIIFRFAAEAQCLIWITLQMSAIISSEGGAHDCEQTRHGG